MEGKVLAWGALGALAGGRVPRSRAGGGRAARYLLGGLRPGPCTFVAPKLAGRV
jgi:hypothetical protein